MKKTILLCFLTYFSAVAHAQDASVYNFKCEHKIQGDISGISDFKLKLSSGVAEISFGDSDSDDKQAYNGQIKQTKNLKVATYAGFDDMIAEYKVSLLVPATLAGSAKGDVRLQAKAEGFLNIAYVCTAIDAAAAVANAN